MVKFFIGVAGALALLSACAAAPEVESDLAILNVAVIDPATGQVLPNQTVLIDDGMIVAVHASDAVRARSDQLIDGRGRYLMPGLMDMHVHTSIQFLLDPTLQLLLSNGVTGVRDMSADCWEPRGEIYMCIDEMRTIAAEIERGERLGPRLLSLASTFVQSDRTVRLPADPDPRYMPISREDGVVIADYLAERDVDLIKVYHAIFPGAFDGLMEQARLLGVEVSGHVPLLMGAEYASNAGLKSIEHANEVVTECSDYTVEYRAAMNAVATGQGGASWPSALQRLTGSINEFSAERCSALMDVFVANNTYYVPTHGTRELDARAGDPAYRDDPRLRYVGPFQAADWARDLDRTAAADAETREAFADFYALGLDVTRIAHERGVQIMVGTDANDTMIIPGFAVHDELQRLVAAGLTPMDALKAATSVPAEYLGLSDRLGAVAVGYQADLVLLGADPLSDISNTSEIIAVIQAGRVFNRSDLDQMLSDVEARARPDE